MLTSIRTGRGSIVRRLAVTGLAVVMGAGVLALGLVGSRLEAAAPPAGTIGPSQESVSWVGETYATGHAVAVPEQCPPDADPLNALCDHFNLTVNVAASHWDGNTGGAEVSITWASIDDDFDLYIYDSSGTQVASSASGGTTSETAFIQNAAGTYEVRVVPFLIVTAPSANYDGTATFVSQAGGPAPNPVRGTGGLSFNPPATVVDGQRTEGEPINWVNPLNGDYWESGPWGFSTGQSFVHRSTDGGDQFNIVSSMGIRPNAPPGGGDSDVLTDDQNFAYFIDLEGLIELQSAVSNDNGNTWKQNNFAVPHTADDRQWFAIDNGLTGAAVDNTLFMAFNTVPQGSFIYSTPGSTGTADLVGGLVYSNASTNPVASVTTAAPCGQMRFDPVNRNLYYACAAGDHIQLTVGHVNPGQRTGITFTNVNAPASPGGQVGDIFPAVAIDKAGTVYAVWVDEIDHNVYYAYSTTQGQTWSSVRQINGNEANSNVFPWAQAGNAGTLAVAWLGSESQLDSDNMPSWYNNRQAASAFPWYGYASLVRNAASATPNYAQKRFTDQPMHYGQVCNAGLGCTVSGGDRTMADFMALYLDRDGSMRLVYNDTTSQHHGAHIFETRQVAGPSAIGTTINRMVPKNPVTDPTGDAQSPHYFAVTGPGASLPQFDFTQLKLSQPSAGVLRVEMTLNSLVSLIPPAGKTNSLWLTRFQARSIGDGGEASYRIFYVGAESIGGGAATFFAGSGSSAQGLVPGDGCTTTTEENCKIVQYPVEMTATGAVSGNVIRIDVPIQGGFGPDRPIFGDTIYNVTALSAGRSVAPAELYADLDATRAFDYKFSGGVIEPPPGGGEGCKITGGGAIATGSGDGSFTLNPHENLKGKVAYRDGAAADFRSTRLTSVECNSLTHSATVEGEGVSNGVQVTFTVEVIDNGEPGTADGFSIELSNGYSAAGPLIRGNIQVHD